MGELSAASLRGLDVKNIDHLALPVGEFIKNVKVRIIYFVKFLTKKK